MNKETVLSRLWFIRQGAYNRLFRRKSDGLINTDGEVILADLKRFCRADESTHKAGDPYASALLEGRREVWLRIQRHLNMTQSELRQLKESFDD